MLQMSTVTKSLARTLRGASTSRLAHCLHGVTPVRKICDAHGHGRIIGSPLGAGAKCGVWRVRGESSHGPMPAVVSDGWGLSCRLSSARCASKESVEQEMDDTVRRSKHRIPQKRASALLDQLRSEATQALRTDLPHVKSGDAVEVQMLTHKSSKSVIYLRGVVIRKVNKGIDSSILIRDLMYDVEVEQQIPLYSPLVKSIRVMETGFIHQGKKKGKRVRQSRIYYLRGLDQKYYRVTGSRM